MVNKSSSSSTSSLDNASLAQLLRECASLVERNEHSTLLYKAVEALNMYAESSGHTPTSAPVSSNSHHLTRPSFQRPTNQTSTLIANGWIEQIRRSKFRTIWKEVLASLVEARQPGEETTLWIQRETVDKLVPVVAGGSKGKMTLEAIHQIPMKWLLDVKLLDFYGDFRFSIKVYNVPEEFIFRTRDEESCREWVATLISAKECSNSKRATEAAAEVNFPDLLGQKESKSDGQSHSSNGASGTNSHPHSHRRPDSSNKYEFPDLDMNTGHPKPSAPPMMNHSGSNTTTATATATANNHSSGSSRNNSSEHQSHNGGHSGIGVESDGNARKVNNDNRQNVTTSAETKNRMSIKELRAIAHGAGYDTRGMERSDLEKIAAYFAPVSEKTAQYKQQQQQQQPNGSNQHKQTAAQAQGEKSRKESEEEKLQSARRRQEEMKRQEVLKKQTEARMKEEEMRRNQKQPTPPPPQQNYQQHAWQQQSNWNPTSNSFEASSATSSPRRTRPTPNLFESTRFFNYETKSGESGPRRKEPFPSHQQHQHHQYQQQKQQQKQQFPTNTAPPPPSSQQQRTTQPSTTQPSPQPQPSTMPQNTNQQRTCDPTSPLNQKYAKVMASNQPAAASVQDEQAVISSIKRNILITWALVPPQYNMLRPIDQLLSSIHNVFPPFSNVPVHEYFSKWQPISHPDLLLGSAMSGADGEKLKKAVRKLRVFLHPDRLPKEFDSKQSFVCKMLWDVSNDAYEEFLKSKEDLDWIGS